MNEMDTKTIILAILVILWGIVFLGIGFTFIMALIYRKDYWIKETWIEIRLYCLMGMVCLAGGMMIIKIIDTI